MIANTQSRSGPGLLRHGAAVARVLRPGFEAEQLLVDPDECAEQLVDYLLGKSFGDEVVADLRTLAVNA